VIVAQKSSFLTRVLFLVLLVLMAMRNSSHVGQVVPPPERIRAARLSFSLAIKTYRLRVITNTIAILLPLEAIALYNVHQERLVLKPNYYAVRTGH
jgi:hypothetical protein